MIFHEHFKIQYKCEHFKIIIYYIAKGSSLIGGVILIIASPVRGIPLAPKGVTLPLIRQWRRWKGEGEEGGGEGRRIFWIFIWNSEGEGKGDICNWNSEGDFEYLYESFVLEWSSICFHYESHHNFFDFIWLEWWNYLWNIFVRLICKFQKSCNLSFGEIFFFQFRGWF